MQISNLRSSYKKVGEIVFFGRMLDKIRLYAQGKLPDDYNRGVGLDGQCLRFLQIDYDALVRRVLLGGTDEEILEWCFENEYAPIMKKFKSGINSWKSAAGATIPLLSLKK